MSQLWNCGTNIKFRTSSKAIHESNIQETICKLSKCTQSIKLDTLEIRRQKLNLKFARGCLKIDKLCSMFPLNEIQHNMDKRSNEKFKVNHARTERYRHSPIPYLQRLLNSQS